MIRKTILTAMLVALAVATASAQEPPGRDQRHGGLDVQ
jgi:hypothetical protein